VTESKGAMRAVDRMVDAIRAEEPPDLDWEAVERSLLVRIRRGEGAKPAPRPVSSVWQVLAFAAAAALVPLGLSAAGGSAHGPAAAAVRAVDASQVAAAPGEAGARGERDLGALRSGDAIEAKASPVTFTDGGKVRWTLSPDSGLVVRAPFVGPEAEPVAGGRRELRAHVAPSGIGHVVQLTRGSIRVEVEPELAKQAFVDVLAVEVGNTRVAVHGTVFTVTLRDGEVLVDVEHGVVTVGPTGQRGATTGYQLPAGSSAAFSLDGARSARWIPRGAATPAEAVAALETRRPGVAGAVFDRASEPAAVLEPAPEPAVLLDRVPDVAVDRDTPAVIDPPPAPAAKPSAPAQVEPSPPASKDGAAAQPEPAAEPPKPTMTTASVQAALQRCFQQAHPRSSADGPKLTGASTFTLKIRADGSVESAQFSPPLPSIQGCAALVYGGRFQTGTSSYTLAIPVQLTQ
jgi:hypothetical protein